MYDNKKDLFVWIGKGASKEEQHNALTYAHVSFIYVDIFFFFFFHTSSTYSAFRPLTMLAINSYVCCVLSFLSTARHEPQKETDPTCDQSICNSFSHRYLAQYTCQMSLLSYFVMCGANI